MIEIKIAYNPIIGGMSSEIAPSPITCFISSDEKLSKEEIIKHIKSCNFYRGQEIFIYDK